MRKKIISIFVPHLGCPHDCIFCNQKKITGQSTSLEGKDVKKEIEKALETLDKSKYEIEIAFFGGTFTAIDLKKQEELLSVAFEYKSKGDIQKIRLSTRPDAIDQEILSFLKKFSVTTIELGVQSMDEIVLKQSLRGHTCEDVYKACDLIKNNDFELGLQMMIGLPEDSAEKDIKTAMEFIKINPKMVRIYPTLVIKDTQLYSLFEKNLYMPYDLDKAIEISKQLLVLFETNKIPVIRLGLQASDEISLSNQELIGPYHPSFRELVETELYKDFFIYKKDFLKEEIFCKRGEISKIVGNNKKNKLFFYQKFKINFKLREFDEGFLNFGELEICKTKEEFYKTLKTLYFGEEIVCI